MKACLIRSPILVPRTNITVQFTPPIGVAYLAASLRAAGHQVTVIDGVGESLDTRHAAANDCFTYGLSTAEVVGRIPADVELIGLSTTFTFEWPYCRELITAIRQRFPNVPLVGGGEHATALPDFSLSDSALDIVAMGEGEEIIVDLATTLEKGGDLASVKGIVFKASDGEFVRTGRRDRMRVLDNIPWPAWDLIPITEYMDRELGFGVNRGRSMPIVASRGCPYQCTFCSNSQMWTTRWLARDPDNLLDEIEHYQKTYNAQNFDFYDLTAIVKKAWIVEFCNKVRQRGLSFTWQLPTGTRSEAIDAEVALLLYQSGCRNLSYSPESGSEAVLSRIKKKIDLGKVLESVRSSVAAGLNVKCNIVIGFPGESYQEIFDDYVYTIRLALAGSHDMSFWTYSPYPGSELFEQLLAKGRIKVDDEYFNNLRAFTDTHNMRSFNDRMSARRLRQLQWTGTLLFYLVAWTVRPMRPLRFLSNLFSGRYESRSEQILANVFRSRRLKATSETAETGR